MPQTRYVRTSDGVDLAYQLFEGGPADLVLVHAYIGAMEVFGEWEGTRRLYRGLSSFSRLVEFDGRGTGLSGRAGAMLTLERRVKDLGTILDAAGLERAAPFTMADGAAAASMFAAAFPQRVTALALFNPILRTAWAEDYPWGATATENEEFQASMWQLWNTPDPTPEQIASVSGDIGAMGDDPDFSRWWARSLRYAITPAEMGAFDAVWMDTDVRQVLPVIYAPTVVLHRAVDEDELAP